MSEGLSAQKKAPIWDLFFAAQFLWPQHFLHSITDENMDQFMYVVIKQVKKLIKSFG